MRYYAILSLLLSSGVVADSKAAIRGDRGLISEVSPREAAAGAAMEMRSLGVRSFLDADGRTIMLARVRQSSGSGLRLYLKNVALPEGAELYVYGLDAAGNAAGVQGPFRTSGPLSDGQFWTGPIDGAEAVIEVQMRGIVTADMPLELGEVEPLDERAIEQYRRLADAAVGLPEEPAAATETRTGVFRGRPVSYQVRGGLAIAEGDIMLGTPASLEEGGWSTEGVGRTLSSYRWPRGVIPYVIEADVPSPSRITNAVAHWNTKMAGVITLVPRTNEQYYLAFKRTTTYTCQSYIGYLQQAGQPIQLHDACSTSNAIHEIGHSVGLYHEHTREDRDRYVKINWENISSGASYNFNQNISGSTDYGLYDYGSIMHYKATTFSANGLPTIETIPAGIPIGVSSSLSAGDIAAIRMMYELAPAPVEVTVQVTVKTSPAGLPVVIDGVSYTGTATLYWKSGTAHTVQALVPAPGAARYTFQRWSDGGAQSHTITTPSTNLDLTATYSTELRVTASSGAGGTAYLSPASVDSYYPYGATVAAVATPSAGYCTIGWTGTSTLSETLSLTISRALSLIANFQSGSVSVPAAVEVDSRGGEVTIPVSATSGCIWAAIEPVPLSWLGLRTSRGTGPGTITVAVTANKTPSPRSGAIVVNGQTLVVNQQGR